MPERATIERAHKKARQGKAPSTQAGEFVKDEIDKIRSGKNGARSAKQAVAIGLSEARKAGVRIPSKKASSSRKTKTARRPSSETSAKRARASLKALKQEPTSSVSHAEMSKFAKQSAQKRGSAGLRKAGKKAAHTRQMRAH